MSQVKTEDQYNLIDWFVKCLKNYANFTGRARRKEFWFFTLVYMIITTITIVLDLALKTYGVITGFFILAMIVPQFQWLCVVYMILINQVGTILFK